MLTRVDFVQGFLATKFQIRVYKTGVNFRGWTIYDILITYENLPPPRNFLDLPLSTKIIN